MQRSKSVSNALTRFRRDGSSMIRDISNSKAEFKLGKTLRLRPLLKEDEKNSAPLSYREFLRSISQYRALVAVFNRKFIVTSRGHRATIDRNPEYTHDLVDVFRDAWLKAHINKQLTSARRHAKRSAAAVPDIRWMRETLGEVASTVQTAIHKLNHYEPTLRRLELERGVQQTLVRPYTEADIERVERD